MGVGGRPVEIPCLWVVGGTVGQASNAHADRARVVRRRHQCADGVAESRFVERVVAVEGIQLQAQGLALIGLQPLHRVELRHRVGVGDDNAQRLHIGTAAVGDSEVDVVGADLDVARCPVEDAGTRVQRRAPGQVGPEIAQFGRLVAAARELDAHHITLANRAITWLDELGRLLSLGDEEGHRGLRDRRAIADQEAHVEIGARGVIRRHPRKAATDRIEGGTGWQVVGPQREAVALGVSDDDVELDRLTLAALNLIRCRHKKRSPVALRDRDDEGLQRHGAANVEGGNGHRRVGRGIGARRPGGTAADDVHRHAARPLDQRVVDGLVVGVDGVDVIGPDLIDLARQNRCRLEFRRAVERAGARHAGGEVDPPTIRRGHRDRATRA